MAAPSKIAAARDAVDRSIRTERMAQVMRDREAGDGACTFAHLAAAGFTEAEIEAYVAHNALPITELPGLIAQVHTSLAGLGTAPEPAPVLTPPVPIKKTLTPDHIISLEDGKPYKTLKRHLAGRGMTPDEYRRKWGLPPNYPMVAESYAAQRADIAKASGLGRSRAA